MKRKYYLTMQTPNFLKTILIVFIVANGLSGCKKANPAPVANAAEMLSFNLNSEIDTVQINKTNDSIYVSIDPSVLNGHNLIANFTLSQGAKAFVQDTAQVSGNTSNNFESAVLYTVKSADNSIIKEWTVVTRNNSFTLDWGLGYFLSKFQKNDRDYEWYMDQLNTGTYAIANCGPTVVTMAIKWADSTFEKSPSDARNTYEINGGDWYTSDINHYLADNKIAHAIIPLGNNTDSSANIIIHQIDQGRIVILCIDMNLVSYTSNPSIRVDKFYKTTPAWGHFFIVKGYTVVSDQIYFQIYDPNSWNQKYADGTLKGKDRFYRAGDVFSASSNWWNYAIVVARNPDKLDPATLSKALDPSVIKHAHSTTH